MANDGEDETGYYPPPSQITASETIPAEPQPWVEYVLEQAEIVRTNAGEAAHSTFLSASNRLSEIGSTATAHSLYTIDMLRDYVAEADDVAFAKLKEGLLVAAAHPTVSCGVAAGLGIIGLKRPRKFLLRSFRRFFVNEETLLSSAETKAKVMKESFANLKHEGKKLEERATMAENDFISGKTRLRQAGQRIRGLVHSIYRVEKESMGLKDILRELPRRDASLFRSKIEVLTSQIKKEKGFLGKEVSKITGYGISI